MGRRRMLSREERGAACAWSILGPFGFVYCVCVLPCCCCSSSPALAIRHLGASTALLLFTGSITHGPRQNCAMHSCLALIWRARQAGALAVLPQPAHSARTHCFQILFKATNAMATSHFSTEQGEESTH